MKTNSITATKSSCLVLSMNNSILDLCAGQCYESYTLFFSTAKFNKRVVNIKL